MFYLPIKPTDVGELLRSSLVGLLIFSAAAQAVEFNQVQNDKSSVSFSYKQSGIAMEGTFRKLAAKIAFDPTRASTASAQMDIDLTSIDTGSSEADEEAAGKLWFNSKVYPVAKFSSTGVKALGENRFQASGKLTIKGKTTDVTAPFTFKQETRSGKTVAVFDGGFVIKRLEYAIGEGLWADVSAVANEIPIKFHITAIAANP